MSDSQIPRSQQTVLTVMEDTKLVRQVAIVVVGLQCLIDMKHCTASTVWCNAGATHSNGEVVLICQKKFHQKL